MNQGGLKKNPSVRASQFGLEKARTCLDQTLQPSASTSVLLKKAGTESLYNKVLKTQQKKVLEVNTNFGKRTAPDLKDTPSNIPGSPRSATLRKQGTHQTNVKVVARLRPLNTIEYVCISSYLIFIIVIDGIRSW